MVLNSNFPNPVDQTFRSAEYTEFPSGIVLPTISTIPVLNEAGKVTERVKGPLLMNMGMQFMGAIEREMQG